MMLAGSSVRGLSDVTTAMSASSAARPILGRLVASRSPPHPKTQITRPGVMALQALMALATLSGVWA